MADFEKAIEKTLAHEGGYVNDPDDAGGETKYGISKRAFPAENIVNLTIERAKHLYLINYWKPVRADDIVNQKIAESVFDFAVNAGVYTAVVCAQRALKVKDDGIFGNGTLSAINTIDAKLFNAEYRIEKVRYYAKIVQKKPQQLKYLLGWIIRAIE